MAARRSDRTATDESGAAAPEADELEDVEGVDFADAETDEDAEPSLEAAFADEEDDGADDDLEDDELGDGELADEDEDPTALTTGVDEDPDEEGLDPQRAVVPPEASFDDEEEDAGLVAAVAGENDEEIEGLKDGEFVCRSCYMAKRETQLADAERLLCRDCA